MCNYIFVLNSLCIYNLINSISLYIQGKEGENYHLNTGTTNMYQFYLCLLIQKKFCGGKSCLMPGLHYPPEMTTDLA